MAWFRSTAVLAALAALSGCTPGIYTALRDPGPHNGRVFDEVLIYPYHLGGVDFRACFRPCREPTGSHWGNDWFIPLDPDAYQGWNGLRGTRVRVLMDSRCFEPDAYCGFIYPLWLREVGPGDDGVGLD